MDAYLDIETTGLSPFTHEITVIGVGLASGAECEVVKLYEDDLTPYALRNLLKGAARIFTYNGAPFDVPFKHHRVGVDIERLVPHQDLMLNCWECNLYGGLKAVERTLGIPRRLDGVDGLQAVRLWQQYQELKDQNALDTLLAYNREDVSNLAILREKLAARRR